MTCQWLELSDHFVRKTHGDVKLLILASTCSCHFENVTENRNPPYVQRKCSIPKGILVAASDDPGNMEVVTFEIALSSSCAGSACGTESQSTCVRPKIPRASVFFVASTISIHAYHYLSTMGQALVLLFCSGRSFSVQTLHRKRTLIATNS